MRNITEDNRMTHCRGTRSLGGQATVSKDYRFRIRDEPGNFGVLSNAWGCQGFDSGLVKLRMQKGAGAEGAALKCMTGPGVTCIGPSFLDSFWSPPEGQA